MKKTIVSLLLLIAVTTLIYADSMAPVDIMKNAPDNSVPAMNQQRTRNGAPDYSFHVNPMNIINSYYDYFPGSYDSVPLRMQPSPAGMFDGGGLYLTFQATPEAGGVRRVYYAYLVDGNITSTALLNTNAPANRAEGFPNIDVDMETGNPVFSWHSGGTVDPAILNCYFAFDQYDAIGFPGIFNEAYEVIKNPYTIGDEEGNAFIWPSVFIGPSPNEGMKRVYITAKNHHHNINDLPVENTMIAFADYNTIDALTVYDPDQWTHITIPQLDTWRQQNVRTFRSVIVSRDTGVIAVIGHATEVGEGVEPYNEHEVLFVLENTNYGEGDWDFFTSDPTIRVENPTNPDGDGLPFWRDENDVPFEDMRYKPYVNRHTIAVDDQGNYHFPALYALMNEGNSWYPRLSTTKHVKFDRATQNFVMNDLYPRTEDGSRYLPWATPPQFSEEGNLFISNSWPIYWHDNEDLFHENYHRIISDGPYMVALVQESVKARFYHELSIEAYSSWQSAPETYIFLSNDYGDTWSEPIIMNANAMDTEPSEDGVFDGNFVPELEGLIPTYWYMADDIEMLNENWGRIHLMFFSQNDYGSSIQQNSPITGGTIMYTSLDLKFNDGDETSVERDVQLPSVAMLHNNYPNPFNPSTTISYSVPSAMNVTLEVYNVKGQLVKTLVDGPVQTGERQAVWNGSDNDGRVVGSGVYFYKLTTETHSEMKKMLLVK